MEMEPAELMKLRYPIGEFSAPENVTNTDINHYIREIESLPVRLKAKVENLNEMQLDTPYRPGGWTVRQVVHHLADSHMNAYIRFKLAVTEQNPEIKAYIENYWAELADGKFAPVTVSLQLLEVLHFRWVFFLKTLTLSDYNKSYFHPEKQRYVLLTEAIASYSWHGNHHLAHIMELGKKMGWERN